MSKCYLCNRKLIDRPDSFDNKNVTHLQLPIRHEEHILHNALYGRLKNSEILCEPCGGELNDKIDRGFCSLFESFTEQLKPILASKDHGNNSSPKALSGYLYQRNGERINVRQKGNKIFPIEPSFEYEKENHTVTIYASQKAAKKFKIKVLKDLKNKVDITGIKIEIIDDLSHLGNVGIHFSEGIENFNEKFKMGFNKIAIGYAISKNISRNDLPRVLDTVNQEIIFSNNVVPFYPSGAFDLLIDPYRAISEDGYPTHTLILYTDGNQESKRLVCYVDLFSTFQYYVILNNNYIGDEILETHCQTILKQTVPEINVKNTRVKFLNIIMDELSVERNEIKNMNIPEIYDYLEQKVKQVQPVYEKDLDEVIRRLANRMFQNLMLKKINKMDHLSKDDKIFIESIPDIDKEDELSVRAEMVRIEDETDFFYRRNFIQYESGNGNVLYSTLQRMIEINNTQPELFKSYGHLKFFQLNQFIKNNIKS